jgi:hypothetical protein
MLSYLTPARTARRSARPGDSPYGGWFYADAGLAVHWEQLERVAADSSLWPSKCTKPALRGRKLISA